MKKLMFGAALAATSMVFAATPEAQVYDVCLSIKTTAAASAKLNNKDNPFLDNEDKETVVYRKQASATWKGLIWGCDCEAIDGVWEEVEEYDEISTIKGCIIWDSKTKKPVFVGDGADLSDAESAQDCGFGWNFLNAIDKNGKKVEGAWTMTQDGLACGDTYPLFSFAGAGFGTLCLFTTEGEVDCTSYVKSISGNFAGWMKAPNASTADDWSGCTFCGYKPVYGECEFATAWDYCNCGELDLFDEDKTAAYGTWSVKYNSSTSKKLSKTPAITQDGIDNLIVSIRQVYNFPTAVAAAILAIENTFWQYDPTGCDELSVALAAANKAVEEAEAAVEASKYENLKAAEVKAGLAAVAASNAWDSAKVACAATNELYEIADAAYEKALYQQTNVNATIIWKNSPTDEITNKVVGCKAITDKIAELNGFTLIKMETTIPGLYGIRTCTTWAQCTALVKEFTDATEAAAKQLATTKADLVEAEAAVVKTAAAKQVADDAYTAAQNDLANINLLQYKAEVQLEKAETAQAVAQAAYDDAGCED